MDESVKIKIARNNILMYLDIAYPSGLRNSHLFNNLASMDELYAEALFAKDIAYLKAKGYIEQVDDRLGGNMDFFKRTVKLTATGKEIAEKTKFDTALEL